VVQPAPGLPASSLPSGPRVHKERRPWLPSPPSTECCFGARSPAFLERGGAPRAKVTALTGDRAMVRPLSERNPSTRICFAKPNQRLWQEVHEAGRRSYVVGNGTIVDAHRLIPRTVSEETGRSRPTRPSSRPSFSWRSTSQRATAAARPVVLRAADGAGAARGAHIPCPPAAARRTSASYPARLLLAPQASAQNDLERPQ
jgi:hypothetical protein